MSDWSYLVPQCQELRDAFLAIDTGDGQLDALELQEAARKVVPGRHGDTGDTARGDRGHGMRWLQHPPKKEKTGVADLE